MFAYFLRLAGVCTIGCLMSLKGFAQGLNFDISKFKTPNRRAVIFHISNYEEEAIYCEYIKVGVIYKDSRGEEIGERIVRINAYTIGPKALELELEVGEEHIEVLETIYDGPYIYKFVPRSLEFKCQIKRFDTWSRESPEGFGAMVATKDGGFFASTYPNDDPGNSRENTNIFKFDADGGLISKSTITKLNRVDRLLALPGDTLIYGGTRGTYASDQFIVVGKLLPNGGKAWEWVYDGSKDEEFRDAVLTNDGGVLILGHSYTGGNKTKVVLVKLSGFGDQEWVRSFYLGEKGASARNMIATKDGAYLLTGLIRKDEFSFATVLKKIDSSGNTIWNVQIDEVSQTIELAEDSQGNFVMLGHNWGGVGSRYQDLLKVDKNGKKVWLIDLGVNAEGLIVTKEDEIILSSNNPYNEPNQRAELMKYSSAGKKIWHRFWSKDLQYNYINKIIQLTDLSLVAYLWSSESYIIKFDPLGRNQDFR